MPAQAQELATIGVPPSRTKTEKSNHESQIRQHPKLTVTEKVVYSYA
jgi:hypothetical protein